MPEEPTVPERQSADRPSYFREATPSDWRVPWHRSLQWKLFIPVFLGLVVLVSIQVQLLLESHHKEQSRARERVLTSAGHAVQTEFCRLQAARDHKRDDVDEILWIASHQTRIADQGVRAVFLTPQGEILASSDSLAAIPAGFKDALDGTHPTLVEDSKNFGVMIPVLNRADCRHCHTSSSKNLGWIWVAAKDPEHLLLERVIRRTGFMTIAILSLVFGLTIWALMFMHVRRPLQDMGLVMDRVMHGDLTTRFQVDSKDELGQLGERLNNMVEQLETMDEQLESANLQLMMRAERMVGVGEMASRLAHEIRNPLAGIESVVSIFREDLAEDSPDRVILEETLQQIHRIENTVTDLLTFARPRPLHLEKVSLSAILNELILFCRKGQMAGTHRIELTEPESLPMINGDKDRLSQMFLNVMLNALQIMVNSGELRIALAQIQDDDGNPLVEVCISDSGPGIPAEAAKNIFKAFYTTRTKGTGLGLAISRSVAQQHGGSLEIGHTGPEGTEFVFTIPAGEA